MSPLCLRTLASLLTLSTLTLASAPSIPGFHMVFNDDFTGAAGASPNANNWIIDTGTQYPGGPPEWGTTEVETYTQSNKNVALSGIGGLVITPIRDASGHWTSGRIESRASNFMAAPGKKLRIQASIKLPAVTTANGLGYWPAFWALGHNFRGNYQNWPKVGEIDILENVNGINRIWQGMRKSRVRVYC